MTSQAAPEAASVGAVLYAARDRLSIGSDVDGEARIDVARSDAEILLAHVLGRDRAWLIAHRDDPIADEARARFAGIIGRRVLGEPVAYLTGRRGFWTLDLEVAPGVLIPRAETELIVQLALERVRAEEDTRVVDLGTGSGAIALSIAIARPRSRILAVDASPDALLVARANAERLSVMNIEFRLGNWLDALGAMDRFDLIVGNPPYLAEDDVHLRAGDLRFEPIAALVSGRDGLVAIREIASEAVRRLREGGELLLEHGATQGEAVRAILAAAGYTRIQTWRDLGNRERVSGGVLSR